MSTEAAENDLMQTGQSFPTKTHFGSQHFHPQKDLFTS